MMRIPSAHFEFACSRWSAVLLLAVVCVPGVGHNSASAQAGRYWIAGTVVNSLSGGPVGGAVVAVLAVEDSHRIAAVVSGDDGRFAIEGLPAAKYQLVASKRGYTTAAYDEHEEFSSAIVTGEGEDTGNLVFRLTPGAVVRGVVTADGGDPVEGAQVMLFRKPQGHEPGARIAQVDAATTDDTGAYEFGNLAKGEYLLAVKAEPWYAKGYSAGAMGKPESPAQAALDVAYPVTYFDSTTDEGSATPLVLAGGSREEANINLHAVPALRLVVDAPRGPDGSAAWPLLRRTVFGMEVSSVMKSPSNDSQAGAVEFDGVAPGHYELTQGDPPRVVELDANTSQQVDAAAGTPAAAVNGTLQTGPGAPLTGDAQVTLEPADRGQGFKPLEAGFTNGAFGFPAVAAGAWTLRVAQGGLPVSVVSIATGGRTRKGNRVTVRESAQTLVVTVSASQVRVEGFARKGGKGLAGAMVVLVPRDAWAFPEFVRRDQSDSDGSFSIRNAAAGEYTVVAIEDGWGLDWTRREAIGRYLPGGTAVTVTGTSEKIVRVSGPVAVQER